MIHDLPPVISTFNETIQILRMHPKHMNLIRCRQKNITIRRGFKNIRPGPALIINSDLLPNTEEYLISQATGDVILVGIESVRYTFLDDITPEEYLDDGFVSLNDTINSLKEYYDNITPSTPMTVIRWDI